MEDTLKIGAYAIPWILSLLLAFVYSQVTLGDKPKNLIAVICGIALGIVAIWVAPRNIEAWSPTNIVEHILYGFNAGLTAVGFWKTVNIQMRPPTTL